MNNIGTIVRDGHGMSWQLICNYDVWIWAQPRAEDFFIFLFKFIVLRPAPHLLTDIKTHKRSLGNYTH
jgi:hypothetical protein